MRRLRHKFRAQPQHRGERHYASKLEAEYADRLRLRKEAGEVIGWLEQVPLHLPGKTKYVVDFLVFETSGAVRFIETKGHETETWRLKNRQVKELYPWLEIEVVKRSGLQSTGFL